MAYVTATPGAPAEQQQQRRSITSRLSGLARAVEGTRRTSSFDIRQIMLASGATCMGLGVVAIILGWYGAAHSTYLFQEIPYLISGGLLGVALVAGGGFLFFASWLVRMIEDNHRYNARVERTLERVDHVLGAISDDAASSLTHAQAANGGHAANPPMGAYREGSSDPGSPQYQSGYQPVPGAAQDQGSGGWGTPAPDAAQGPGPQGDPYPGAAPAQQEPPTDPGNTNWQLKDGGTP